MENSGTNCSELKPLTLYYKELQNEISLAKDRANQ